MVGPTSGEGRSVAVADPPCLPLLRVGGASHAARSILRTCPLACKGGRLRHTLYSILRACLSSSRPPFPVPSHAPARIPSFLSSHATPAVPFVSLADEARSPVRSPLAAPPLRRPVPPLVSLVFPLFLEFPVFFSPVVLLSCPSFVSGALAWKHPLRVCPSRVLYLVPLAVMPSDPALTPCNM